MNDEFGMQYDELSLPFPREVEKQLKKGGTSLTYIPISEVINRLNRIIGIANWGSQVVSVGRDEHDPEYIVAHVVLTARFGDQIVPRAGFGGTKIKRMKSGDIVDLGDDYKGAVSDAIKKAAQQFGVGLYLARDDEALRMDEEMYAAPDPEREAIGIKWSAFMDMMKSMDDEGRNVIAEFWAMAYEGQPKPQPNTVTMEQIDDLIAQCMAYKFNGEIVSADD